MRDFDKQMEMVLYHSDEGDVSVDAYIKDEREYLDNTEGDGRAVWSSGSCHK